MTFDGRKTCSTCLGTGNVGRLTRQTCPTCDGLGTVPEAVDGKSVPVKVRSMPDRLRHYASLLADAPTEWTENGPPTVAAIAFGLEMLADEMEEEQ